MAARLVFSALVCFPVLASAPAAERGLFDVSNRFLDGTVSQGAARLRPVTTVIDSFEDEESLKSWFLPGLSATLSDAHATEGAKSLQANFRSAATYAAYRRGS